MNSPFNNKTVSVLLVEFSQPGTDGHEEDCRLSGRGHITAWYGYGGEIIAQSINQSINNCSHLLCEHRTELSSQSGGVKRHAGCCVASVAPSTNLSATVRAQSLLWLLRIADDTQCMLIICGKHGEAVVAKQCDVWFLLCWASGFIYGAVATTKCVCMPPFKAEKQQLFSSDTEDRNRSKFIFCSDSVQVDIVYCLNSHLALWSLNPTKK